MGDDLTSQQATELKVIACGCEDVLVELNRTLKQYVDLGRAGESSSKKLKRVWKRLAWEPDDIRDLRNRIVSNITLLNAFQGKRNQ